MQQPTTDWLASGGTFWVLGLGWTFIAVLYAVNGMRYGNKPSNEGDGCLLAIAGIIMTLLGGGIGLILGRYPWYVITSLAGAIVLPGIVTGILIAKSSRRR